MCGSLCFRAVLIWYNQNVRQFMLKSVLAIGLTAVPCCAAGDARDSWPCESVPKFATTASGGAVWKTWEDLKGRVVSKLDPRLPPGARLDAVVLVEVVVDSDGYVKCARLPSKKPVHPLVKQPALESARSYRFRPILLDEKPAVVLGKIPIHFVTAGVTDAEVQALTRGTAGASERKPD